MGGRPTPRAVARARLSPFSRGGKALQIRQTAPGALQLDDIRRKAERLYGEFIRAWLAGDRAFFPREIRGRKVPDSAGLAAASQAVRSLRAGSKEAIGFGYSIEWREIRSRKFGRNQFPRRIFFESAEDLLRFLGRKEEFETLDRVASRLRGKFDALDSWIRANPKACVEIAPDLDGLIEVLSWFCQHPRPGLHARELPLSVHTKFIRDNETVLREWFDLVLSPEAIRADEETFERRYGLRCVEPHLLVRFLDSRLQRQIGFPCDELSLPLHVLAQLPAPKATVFVVENKVNLFTLPRFDGGLALGGLGYGVTRLRSIPWLEAAPIWYWGDIDTDGFQILSMLRTIYPQVASFLMDRRMIERYRRFAVSGTGRKPDSPGCLTAEEERDFRYCRDNNLRIEQERISQNDVMQGMADLSRRFE